MDEELKKHAFTMELAMNLGMEIPKLIADAHKNNRDSIPLDELDKLLFKVFMDMSNPNSFHKNLENIEIAQAMKKMTEVSDN